MELVDFEVNEVYDIHIKVEREELVSLYETLMSRLGFPDHFWEGKSPSCEVEEFLIMLWKIINQKVGL